MVALPDLFESNKKEFQQKEETEYLTRQELANMLKVDLSTIHFWTKKGKLKSYGIGNRVYFKKAEVEASLKAINNYKGGK